MSLEPYYCAPGVTLYLGDCIEVMRELPEASIDAVVCDPPYGLGFMGKAWDRFEAHEFQEWCEAWAREAFRVAKPGAHIAAFGGTRTYQRLACGIEDAGFIPRDMAAWMFGSGFPKSLDVSKAIDRAAGAEREVIGKHPAPGSTNGRLAMGDGWQEMPMLTAPATDAAKQWQGWGTALKPAHEPICLARKPLDGTVAQNVLQHGTGALNIEATRIGTEGGTFKASKPSGESNGIYGQGINGTVEIGSLNAGRWPANVLLDDEAAALLDATVGERVSGKMMPTHTDARRNTYGQNAAGGYTTMETYGDRGGPSRFFYTAKASRSEREAGLEELPPALRTDGRPPEGPGADNPRLRVSERHNDHPTVKPVSLMRWLIRLVTPPGGVVLDPFLGSGTTALAALDERMQVIGIDMTERYVEIARYRVTHRHVLDEPVVREATEALPQGRLL